MIQDTLIVKSVSRITQRAERQSDPEKVVASYVDIGVLPQINNSNNQILFGRRGTGKTHILRVLASRLREENRTTIVYIDARTLGSTTQFSDATLPMPRRCLALFRDILLPIYEELLDYIVYHPSEKAEMALAAVDDLMVAIVDPVVEYREDSVTTTSAVSTTRELNAGASIGTPSDASLQFGVSSQKGLSGGETRSYKAENEDKVFFPELYETLQRTLTLADVRIYILIDEWSSLPQDVQPYLAEFLKRGVLPVRDATIKIASLEYRSRFSLRNGDRLIGFELGADLSISLDLDDYFVFDRNPEEIASTYAKILLAHMLITLSMGCGKRKERKKEDGKQKLAR